METRWRHVVLIACKRTGSMQAIATTQQALHCLLTHWPIAEGAAYMRALQICEGVEAKRARADEAEAAFRDACDEAHITYDVVVPSGVIGA